MKMRLNDFEGLTLTFEPLEKEIAIKINVSHPFWLYTLEN